MTTTEPEQKVFTGIRLGAGSKSKAKELGKTLEVGASRILIHWIELGRRFDPEAKQLELTDTA